MIESRQEENTVQIHLRYDRGQGFYYLDLDYSPDISWEEKVLPSFKDIRFHNWGKGQVEGTDEDAMKLGVYSFHINVNLNPARIPTMQGYSFNETLYLVVHFLKARHLIPVIGETCHEIFDKFQAQIERYKNWSSENFDKLELADLKIISPTKNEFTYTRFKNLSDKEALEEETLLRALHEEAELLRSAEPRNLLAEYILKAVRSSLEALVLNPAFQNAAREVQLEQINQLIDKISAFKKSCEVTPEEFYNACTRIDRCSLLSNLNDIAIYYVLNGHEDKKIPSFKKIVEAVNNNETLHFPVSIVSDDATIFAKHGFLSQGQGGPRIQNASTRAPLSLHNPKGSCSIS